MKAISVLQPWASELLGPKDIENRNWRLPSAYLGVMLALHASKRLDERQVYEYERARCQRGWPNAHRFIGGLPFGAIIGVITFSQVVTASESSWFFGPFGWVRSRVQALPAPIPCRGALALWEVPAEIVAAIHRQLDGESAEQALQIQGRFAL